MASVVLQNMSAFLPKQHIYRYGKGCLVPREGVEPTRPFGQRILSPPRLPFRHLGHAGTVCSHSGAGAIGKGMGEGEVEATGGIEPPNKGFADPRLNHLATSPRCAGAQGGTRTHTGCPTAPSRPRVYQFHHLGQTKTKPNLSRRRHLSSSHLWSVSVNAGRLGAQGLVR